MSIFIIPSLSLFKQVLYFKVVGDDVMTKYFTIGMAGHIDHGKTTLTKALTGINTDRLKEEQERKISIEPGFAPLFQEEDLTVSIIDVPGHERFIRQMIAGVAGIDLFLIVIDANEGVMPQTKEHLEILSLLGITDGMIVFTKRDEVDDELFEIVLEDVEDQLSKFSFKNLPMFEVDSLSGKGISSLKEAIKEKLQTLPKRESLATFRLPIDQVFTIKGQGTIVRGTVFDGKVKEGDELILLPSGKSVRVRQIQRHNERKAEAKRGQRAAINLGGINYDELKRGDVLVSKRYFSISNRFDIVFFPLQGVNHPIKQRQSIKVHIGTSEVMGRIIFFDRNEIHPESSEQEIFCQIEVEEKVVLSRGDRLILRRPTPAETIGGGWIIEPEAKKHRFGKHTVEQLKRKKDGTPKERIVSILEERIMLPLEEIARLTSLTKNQLKDHDEVLLKVTDKNYTLKETFTKLQKDIVNIIDSYHEKHPLRIGLNKAEVVSTFNEYPEVIIELAIEDLQQKKKIMLHEQYVGLFGKEPSLPEKWANQLKEIEQKIINQGLEVDYWNHFFNQTNIPENIQRDYYHYLVETNRAYVFDQDRLISASVVERAKKQLTKEIPEETFTLQRVREVLPLTRRNLIPLLELFDELGYTARIGNERKWL